MSDMETEETHLYLWNAIWK